MNLADLPITEVTPQIHPFYQAYHRPYPEALTWREYRNLGYEPIERTKVGLAEIEESFDELIQYTIDEDGFVVPLQGDERSDWLSRRINAWSRKKEWTL